MQFILRLTYNLERRYVRVDLIKGLSWHPLILPVVKQVLYDMTGLVFY